MWMTAPRSQFDGRSLHLWEVHSANPRRSYTHTHPPTHPRTLTPTHPPTHTNSQTHTHTHSQTHPHTHSLTLNHTLTHAPALGVSDGRDLPPCASRTHTLTPRPLVVYRTLRVGPKDFRAPGSDGNCEVLLVPQPATVGTDG